MKTNLLLLILMLPLAAFSQTTTCTCCTEPYRQFDFWLGAWTVHDSTGKLVGENHLVMMHDSCLMQENYSTPKGYTGTSYNYYNAQDSSWNQTWVDNQGGSLLLKGRLKGDKMVLRSSLQKGKKGPIYHRITWFLRDDGAVIQIWDVLNEKDEVVQQAFWGEYRRKI
ncbi:MAG: hypothetical protein R3B47_15275 [Bacteroidia bacterium]